MNDPSFDNDLEYSLDSVTKGDIEFRRESSKTSIETNSVYEVNGDLLEKRTELKSGIDKETEQRYFSNKPKRIIIRARIIHDQI